MVNIWSFLCQTLTASLVAALLLVVKRLFLDKLSPRWQYGIWAVLALRLLLPAGLGGRYVLFDWRLWLETVKTAAERRLPSVLSSPFALTEVFAPIPLFPNGFLRPESVTDLLFYLYAAGVLLSLLWFFLSYLRLRRSLRGAAAPDGAVLALLDQLCRRYGLKLPRTVAVLPGAGSAFVCGPFKSVLILPAGRTVDEKVLLHELLHLKYGDIWIGILLCVLRCLHWCNPLIWYCCDRAQNDCESLCDQRVLERLEGEERRDYGRILLSMADDAHARAPGTSSMANGGRNIKRRIQAIARFKRYPSGMALASLCVAAVLALTCLVGTTPAAAFDAVPRSTNMAMAQARLSRPSTPAGALDTYVKAVLSDNGVYLAAVTPQDEQGALWRQLEGADGFHLGLSAPLEDSGCPWIRSNRVTRYQAQWQVLNLLPDGQGGYRGLLVLRPAGGEAPLLGQTVRICPQDRDWTVLPETPLEPLETKSWSPVGDACLPSITYIAQAGGLRFEIELQYSLGVDNRQVQDGSALSLLGQTALDPLPRPDTPFTDYEYAAGGRACDLTGAAVTLSRVQLTPLSTAGRAGGCSTTLSLPIRTSGGGGFSSGQGVGLDCAAALSLAFTYRGLSYSCVALPEGGLP